MLQNITISWYILGFCSYAHFIYSTGKFCKIETFLLLVSVQSFLHKNCLFFLCILFLDLNYTHKCTHIYHTYMCVSHYFRPMDCSPLGSSVHGVLKARRLQWIAILFPQGIFPTQGSNPHFLHFRQILHYLSHQGSIHTYVYIIHIVNINIFTNNV